jgi:hypothetical protein
MRSTGACGLISKSPLDGDYFAVIDASQSLKYAGGSTYVQGGWPGGAVDEQGIVQVTTGTNPGAAH